MSSFDITAPFHVGFIVADVEAEMAQLTAATGITWHPPADFVVDIDTADGRVQYDVHFTYSKEGPVQVELAQGPPGTFWDVPMYGGPNHNGYWSDDLIDDIDELTRGGFDVLYSGAIDDAPGPQNFAMLRAPSGLRVELIDRAMEPLFQNWYRTGAFE